MLLVAWILSLIAVGYLGYCFERIKSEIENIQEKLKTKADARAQSNNEKSTVYDPYDVEQRARLEHEAMMRKLNG